MSSSDADSPDQAAPQPPPTVVPLRPYKTLAPKPASAKRSIRRAGSKAHLFPFVRQVPRSPVCPICQRNNCQLASHKSFLKSITSKEKSKSASSSPEAQPRPSQVANTLYKKSYAYQFASFVDTDLAASRIDPFVSLPIPDSSHPQLHALLHDCKRPLHLQLLLKLPVSTCLLIRNIQSSLCKSIGLLTFLDHPHLLLIRWEVLSRPQP